MVQIKAFTAFWSKVSLQALGKFLPEEVGGLAREVANAQTQRDTCLGSEDVLAVLVCPLWDLRCFGMVEQLAPLVPVLLQLPDQAPAS